MENSPSQTNVACRPETIKKQEYCRSCVMRIDGESSQLCPLCILPHAQRSVSISNLVRDFRVARIELFRPFKIGQGALPFTAPTVNKGAKLLS
jgi:hypothetical protein